MNILHDAKKLGELRDFYKKHLLEDVLSFWENRTEDLENGGFFSEFDRVGNLTGYDKSVWVQARQTWTFASVFNNVEKDEKWLRLAKHGRDYLVKHAYAGDGRWHYLLDRHNNVVAGPVSVFSDMFALCGLCEYAVASGSTEDMKIIRDTFDKLYENITNPAFCDFFPYKTGKNTHIHGIYMLCINALSVARPVLVDGRADELMHFCLDKVFNVFVNDEYKTVLETVTEDFKLLEADEGFILNPGHAFESMWFCIEEAKKLSLEGYCEKGLEVVDWLVEKSFDKEYGGIYYILDARGRIPVFSDWHAERNLKWDEKVWWTNCEAMYAVLLAAKIGDNVELFDKFIELQDFALSHFFDREYGEWFSVLNRDGTFRISQKGGYMKSAFHLPRTLIKVYLLLLEMAEEAG